MVRSTCINLGDDAAAETLVLDDGAAVQLGGRVLREVAGGNVFDRRV